MSKKILLISEQQVKQQTVIEAGVDAKVLSKSIQNVQETHLKGILGGTLYDSLMNAVELKILSGTTLSTVYSTLLTDYIRPYLIHATVTDLLVSNQFKITNKGVLKLNDNSATALNSDELEYAVKHFNNYTTTYKSNLEKFLIDNDLVNKKRIDTNSSGGWFLEKNNYKFFDHKYRYYR